MNGQRRLGRGLEALLGEPLGNHDASDDGSASDAGMADAEGFAAAGGSGAGIVQLSAYEIDTNPFQPRREFDEAENAVKNRIDKFFSIKGGHSVDHFHRE